MACASLALYRILPAESIRININPNTTQELSKLIEEVENPNQAVVFTRMFFNRYPEEVLLEKSIQRFFEVRKIPCMNSWQHELISLLSAIRSGHLTEWEFMIYNKVMLYCPAHVDEFWGEEFPVPSVV